MHTKIIQGSTTARQTTKEEVACRTPPYWFDHQERFVSVKWSIRVQLITFAWLPLPYKTAKTEESETMTRCNITGRVATPSLVDSLSRKTHSALLGRDEQRCINASFSLFNMRSTLQIVLFDFAIPFMGGWGMDGRRRASGGALCNLVIRSRINGAARVCVVDESLLMTLIVTGFTVCRSIGRWRGNLLRYWVWCRRSKVLNCRSICSIINKFQELFE